MGLGWSENGDELVFWQACPIDKQRVMTTLGGCDRAMRWGGKVHGYGPWNPEELRAGERGS